MREVYDVAILEDEIVSFSLLQIASKGAVAPWHSSHQLFAVFI